MTTGTVHVLYNVKIVFLDHLLTNNFMIIPKLFNECNNNTVVHIKCRHQSH